MGPIGCMVCYALFVWWFSTGAILFLNHLPAWSFRWSMAGCTAVLAGALICLATSAQDTSVRGAYAGFTCGVWAWGWHEMSFFMGFVTGRRHAGVPPGRGWVRLRQATETLIYHQLAIAATAVLMLVITAHAPNKVGLWTFLALWAMRLSANINVYLGVRNLNEQFLPPHLAYLRNYMRRRNMNWLLPFSMLGGTAAAWWFASRAATAPSPFQSVGNGFIAAMLSLAVVEHAFMVIPLPFAALWNWCVGPAARRPTTMTSAALPGRCPLRGPENRVVARAFATQPASAHKNSI